MRSRSLSPFARAIALLLCAVLPLGAAHAQIDLRVTISNDPTPGSCGTEQSLEVSFGDQINYCYTVTNDSGDDLRYHTLVDTHEGIVLQDYERDLPPGQTFQYNIIRTAGVSETRTSTWTASTALPDYEIASQGPDPDRVFADGFDGGPATDAFEDISATGTHLELDDDGEANVTIGFDFVFFGAHSQAVTVGNNGGILFNTIGADLGYNNLELPNATLGPAILPFWDDFDSETGGVYAQTLGNAPNRRLIVEWKDRVHYDGADNTDPATFEAIFREGSNQIVFAYADVDMDGTEFDGGASATIGLNQGNYAAEFSYDTASVAAGSTIAFTPTTAISYSDSDTDTLEVGVARLVVTPTALDASVAAGASTTAPLEIANDGNRDLEWSLTEANASGQPIVPRAPPVSERFAQDTRVLAPRRRVSALFAPDKTPRGADVPAYGVNLNVLDGNTFVSLDAAHPENVTVIAPTSRTLVGGAFLNNDFSKFYTIDFDTGDFLYLDTSDGSETVIGNTGIGGGVDSWSGLAADPGTSILYGTTTQMSGGLSSWLYSIDATTGHATPIGPMEGVRIIDIAIGPGGARGSLARIFGVDIAGDNLVDLGSGVVGPLGFNAEFAEGLDFDQATGTLYFAAVNDESVFSQPGQMYTIDTTTGHATLVGGISADPAGAQISAFAIATVGGCTAPQDIPWLSESPTSGTTPPGTSSDVTVTFDASALAPGAYSANLCVHSNDPSQSLLRVPVSLTVE